MKRHIALLRGINVGKAKRVPMADLRALMEGLGYTGVRTLLEPGNFARFRANAAAIKNRAVFEIPDMLDAILQQKSPAAR